MLDVVNIAPNSLAGWVAVAVRVITRRRRGHERVEHWQARSIVIRTDVAAAVRSSTATRSATRTELRIRVEPAALVMRVPAPPPPDAPDPG